jgi:putative GTP pyrophosphokinase
MAALVPTPEQTMLIDALVKHYQDNRALYRRFLKALHSQISDAIDPENRDPLSKLVHSVKYRLKDPDHLRDKLIRKLAKCNEEHVAFPYTIENLFTEITDLAGYRILHLHTRQMGEIAIHLREVLEVAHKIKKGPVAKTWDDETRQYYESVGIETEPNERMYSSVHYDVQPNSRPPLVTIEIQVRTLADEIWGEIDHKINYPKPHLSVACREQIRALARATSTCSRLVDAIVTSHEDWEQIIEPGLNKIAAEATVEVIIEPPTQQQETSTDGEPLVSPEQGRDG